ncbi:MAG: DUF3786 domain-containing protein [Desulfobacteraceae bacterium]|jgi:hypothetical protein
MKSNYAQIIEQNLTRLFSRDLNERSYAMAARLVDDEMVFDAFGGRCRISAKGITMDDREETGPMGIILSLYALNAVPDPIVLQPFKAFKEFPNSAPYVGAFAAHTEQILVPAVDRIGKHRNQILEAMAGAAAPGQVGGDSAMVVRALPKIALCYIFYDADEDFPASATCLFSHNANLYMPMDGLADVGEYTSRKILEMVRG